MAVRTLATYRIGRVKQDSGPITPFEKHSKRPAEIIGGYLPSMSERQISVPDASPLWKVQCYGFLPFRDPVPLSALDGTDFEVFANLVELLAALSSSGSFRKYVNSNASLQDQMRRCTADSLTTLTEDQLERAFSAVGFCLAAYWHGAYSKYARGLQDSMNLPLNDASVEPVCTIPDFIGLPMLALAAKLQRPPFIDYAATVLYNWERIDPNGPIVAHNIRTVTRLTALGDEEWFFKTHVVIESESAPAVEAIMRMIDAEDDTHLLQNLDALEEALWRVVRACMPLMYERIEQGIEHGVSRCNEHIFYAFLRPLLSTGRIKFEGDPEGIEHLLHGPSGAMSSLLPAVDAALGIKMTSQKLRQALDKFEKSMPLGHQSFLERLRDRDSIRDRLQMARPIGGGFDDHYEALVRSFNRCISRVLDFRWQHWQYVKNFIMKPGNLNYAVGTGGTSFDYLQQHITDTEQARLQEHRQGGFTVTISPDDVQHLPHLAGVFSDGKLNLPGESGGLWSVDGPRGLLAAEPMLPLECWGAWEAAIPAELHTAIKGLLDLCMRLPSLCLQSCEGVFLARCEAMKDQLAALGKDDLLRSLSEGNRERILTLLNFISTACRANASAKKMPKCIDRPMQVLARLAGRSAQVDSVSIFLANWAYVEDEHPHTGETNGDSHPRSFRIVCAFIANPDEEWYRAVHLVLHDSARDAVAAIRAGQHGMTSQDDGAVIQSLEALSEWMSKVCDYMDAHFELKDSRTEAISFRRLAKFVAQDWFDDEQTACWVYCGGCSVLLPMLHAVLGVDIFDFPGQSDSSEVERLSTYLSQWSQEMKLFMPVAHRTFLENLQRPGVSLRQYCIKRFGSGKATPVDVLHGIEVAYNEALNGLVRFLSRRMHLVVRFLPEQSSSFATLHGHIEGGVRKNRLQLLKMRQRVDACLEGVS
jgi:indoleamine 2,3-dioxygenase